MSAEKKIDILDCTLRDAGYRINFQFTAEDAAVTAAALESAGVKRIEVGHGLGLGASGHEGLGIAAASDEEYFGAVADVLEHAMFGAFIIPGIGTLKDVDGAARLGAGFIRIGTDVVQTEIAEPFVRQAKASGLEVSANLMKTYAVPEDEVVRRAEQMATWGIDTVAVVDSAGGMFPHEVTNYVKRLIDNLDVTVGFHGHNNIHLAVANCIAAAAAGATVIDTTLCGMGRSLGNAATEVVALNFQKLGYETGIDLLKILDVAEKLVAPYMATNSSDSLELIFGYSKFHSGFYPLVRKAADQFNVDPRLLVMRLSESDVVSVTEEQALSAAEQICSDRGGRAQVHRTRDIGRHQSHGFTLENSSVSSSATAMASEVFNIAAKTKRRSVFTIAWAPAGNDATRFPSIYADKTKVVGNAEVANVSDSQAVTAALDGKVDVIMVDVTASDDFAAEDLLTSVEGAVEKSQVLRYSDRNAHILSTEALVRDYCHDLRSICLAICGANDFGLEVAVRLMRSGGKVVVYDSDKERAAGMNRILGDYSQLTHCTAEAPALLEDTTPGSVNGLIGCKLRQISVGKELIDYLADTGLVVDAGVGSLSPDAILAAQERGLDVRRVDMRTGLLAEVDLALATSELVHGAQGRKIIDGVRVVGGGVIGTLGTVVVDDVAQPTRVIGIADGVGGLLDNKAAASSFNEDIKRVRTAILRLRMP